MFLMRVTRQTEQFWAGDDRREAKENTVGTLAQTVLMSLHPESAPRDAERLLAWVRRFRDAALTAWWDQKADWTAVALAVVRSQLEEWHGGNRSLWRVSYRTDYSELDPWDGPTASLSNPAGRELLEQVRWRLPRDGASRLFSVDSHAACVLLSAFEGILAGRLYACVSCRRLLVRGKGQERRRRCATCASTAAVRKSKPTLYIACERAKDRLRHRLAGAEYVAAQGRCQEVLRRFLGGTLSEPKALRALQRISPRGPRGRRPIT